MFACVEDTTAGVRKPRISTDAHPAPKSRTAGRMGAAQSGPYPSPRGSSGAGGRLRRPAELGTLNTPVAVVAPPAPLQGRYDL